MQRSQRTGELIWVTMRLSTSRPSCTTWPSRLEISGIRASWVETERARPASTSTAGAMCWVWNAPATDSGTSRALAGGSSAKRRELLDGAGRDDLAGAVVVGGGQAVLLELGEHLVAVAAQDRGHAGRGLLRGGGHRVAPLADQHHGLLGGDRAGAGRGGELADAVPGDRTDLVERVGRVREQLEGGEQPGGDQQRLGDGGVADGRPRRPPCRSGRGRGRRRRRARSAGRGRPGSRPRGSGSRGSGHLGREQRWRAQVNSVAPRARTACSAHTKIPGVFL